jgi:hypothetical protein
MTHSQRLVTLCTIAFAALMADASVAHAQDREDLLGSWVLSVSESQFGNTRAPASASLEVTTADTQLVMTTLADFGGSPGQQETELDIPIDGERHSVEDPRGSSLVSAEWDGDQLVIWRRVAANVGEVEMTDRFLVKAGGHRLEVERSIEVPGRPTPFVSTMVYLRQDA